MGRKREERGSTVQDKVLKTGRVKQPGVLGEIHRQAGKLFYWVTSPIARLRPMDETTGPSERAWNNRGHSVGLIPGWSEDHARVSGEILLLCLGTGSKEASYCNGPNED